MNRAFHHQAIEFYKQGNLAFLHHKNGVEGSEIFLKWYDGRNSRAYTKGGSFDVR